jgi:hypothetical protein
MKLNATMIQARKGMIVQHLEWAMRDVYALARLERLAPDDARKLMAVYDDLEGVLGTLKPLWKRLDPVAIADRSEE